MAINEELLNFVRDALAHGLLRTQIEDALLKAGWESSQVKGALSAFAELEFPIPVPRPKLYIDAREVFMYLLLFATLYISAFNFGKLIFQFINQALPDPAVPPGFALRIRESIRWSVAFLIIAFPIFLYMSQLISRAIKRDLIKRTSKIRKQLTYITLFIAICVLFGDLTALVYNFLGGELVLRFLLKILTVGIIAGAIFVYYLWNLRKEESESKA